MRKYGIRGEHAISVSRDASRFAALFRLPTPAHRRSALFGSVSRPIFAGPPPLLCAGSRRKSPRPLFDDEPGARGTNPLPRCEDSFPGDNAEGGKKGRSSPLNNYEISLAGGGGGGVEILNSESEFKRIGDRRAVGKIYARGKKRRTGYYNCYIDFYRFDAVVTYNF